MNLWADFESESQHLSAAPGNRRQMRRLTERVVLSSVREWLLQDYASAYCRALGAMRIYRRCYWVDAWEMGGKNGRADRNGEAHTGKSGKKDEQEAIPSVLQPIVALSEKLAQESRSITLQGLVLETGSSRRKEVRTPRAAKHDEWVEGDGALQDEKSGLKLPKESGIVRGSWLEVAPALLAEIGQSPAIFLLNPFGQTLFGYDDLALLFQRTSAPTELLLLVPHKQVETRLLAAVRGGAGATELTALLHTDRWKTLLLKEGELGARVVDGMLALLVNMLQQHFLWVQKIGVPIRVRPAVVEMAPYMLLFATRSRDSLMGMNDAVCVYGRWLATQSRQGVLGEEWFVGQEEERQQEARQRLYERMLQLGKGQKIRRWPELRQQLLLIHFGRWTVQEYDEVMGKMLSKGDVRCDWRRRLVEGEEPHLPGNEDILLWR